MCSRACTRERWKEDWGGGGGKEDLLVPSPFVAFGLSWSFPHSSNRLSPKGKGHELQQNNQNNSYTYSELNLLDHLTHLNYLR